MVVNKPVLAGLAVLLVLGFIAFFVVPVIVGIFKIVTAFVVVLAICGVAAYVSKRL